MHCISAEVEWYYSLIVMQFYNGMVVRWNSALQQYRSGMLLQWNSATMEW